MMKIYKYLAATITAALFSAALYAQVKTDGKTAAYKAVETTTNCRSSRGYRNLLITE